MSSSNKDAYFISLDQSLSATGWCLWVNGQYKTHGLITCKNIKESDFKLHAMASEICNLLNEFSPVSVWFEDTALQTNPKILKELTKLQGIIIGYCLAKDIDYGIISPNEWRKILELPTGRGLKRPELKKNSIDYVKEKYGISPTEDECEAITIGEAVLKKFNRN